MPETFESMWREIHQYSPSVPAALCQRFVRDSFEEMQQASLWSWGRREGQWTFPAAYSHGVVSVDSGSTAVYGYELAQWEPEFAGRQIQFGGDVFTILRVDNGNHLTIDRVWGGQDLHHVPFVILQAYVTAPEDLRQMVTVADPQQRYRLRTQYPQETLDRIDASRQHAGFPTVVAQAWPDRHGRLQYEVWPRIMGPYRLHYIYQAEVDPVEGVNRLPQGVDSSVIKQGALYRLCQFPGTAEQPNPMFNLQLARAMKSDFDKDVARMDVRDQELYQTDLWYQVHLWPYVPVDSRWLQSHAI